MIVIEFIKMSENKKVRAIANPQFRAKTKYKRIKTIVKNCMEVSVQCGIRMNVLVFGARGMQEYATDDSVRLEKIVKGLFDNKDIGLIAGTDSSLTSKIDKVISDIDDRFKALSTALTETETETQTLDASKQRSVVPFVSMKSKRINK